MGAGCNEKFDLEFLRWIWQFPEVTARTIEERLRRLRPEVKLYRLHSPKDVEEFLREVQNQTMRA